MASSKRQIVETQAWAGYLAATHVPAAVRVGNRLLVTGHTGEDADEVYPPDAATQIRNTFANVAETLAAAGSSWVDVVSVTSYHVGLAAQEEQLLAAASEFLTPPYPAWTAVGVAELWQGALVEIACEAVLPDAPLTAP